MPVSNIPAGTNVSIADFKTLLRYDKIVTGIAAGNVDMED